MICPVVTRDHPRIRGEHVLPRPKRSVAAGSSPHTRGAPPPAFHTPPVRGIIPAYAGSTETFPGCEGCYWDHPRIRGEHIPPQPLDQLVAGSSPHTRGAPISLLEPKWVEGIIPAYAGSTTSPG